MDVYLLKHIHDADQNVYSSVMDSFQDATSEKKGCWKRGPVIGLPQHRAGRSVPPAAMLGGQPAAGRVATAWRCAAAPPPRGGAGDGGRGVALPPARPLCAAPHGALPLPQRD